MSTVTLGTSATNSLTAIIMPPASSGSTTHYQPADIAAINNAIKNDLNPAHPLVPGAYTLNGMLFLPNRGVLRVLPGDFIAVDANGWPVLVSANSIATGGWTHT